MTARILIVDDLLPNIKLLEAKLVSEYYTVNIARSGKEALEVVKKRLPDLILLDVMMPELDGFEVCRRLKNDPDLMHIPVVMITALGDIDDRIRGLKAGADDFLTKPIDDTALFARIRSLVRLKIVMDELRIRNQTNASLSLTNIVAQLHLEGAKIVLVDDDVIQSQGIIDALKEQSYAVEWLSNAQEVMDYVEEHEVDLLIVSTSLTDSDGLRLCSQVRSQSERRNLPILIVVEEDDKKLLIKGLDIGVNDYVITPIDRNELVARVGTQVRRKRVQDALRDSYDRNLSMAATDGLTSLYNRRYFDTHLQKMVQDFREDKPFAMLLFDVDHFKKVNDTYGHVAGDEILRGITQCVQPLIRITDLFARYGGEEFSVLCTNTTMQEACAVAERIRSSIAAYPFAISVEPHTLHITTSIGVAMAQAGDDPETIIKRADRGLYMAKEQGRNKVILSDHQP